MKVFLVLMALYLVVMCGRVGKEFHQCVWHDNNLVGTVCLQSGGSFCYEEIMPSRRTCETNLICCSSFLRQRFVDVCNNNSDAAVMIVMKDTHLKSKNVKGEFVINKIQDFLYDEVFFKYVSCKPMVDVIQSIIGPNISGVHSMLINKPPDSTKDSSRHPLHQDLHYFPFRPADSVVASWTAMETVNEQNGCLFVVPGSHKGELMKHEYPPNVTNKAYHGVLGVDHLPTVNLTMEKGDTVFFHPILLHGSGHNLTKGFRKAISCHYADSNCHFIDVRGTLQEEIEREVLEMAEKRGFGHANFQTIWKAKSRLVRGEPGNFQRLDSHL